VTENICKRLLDYNLHKERSGSNRFAKVRAVLRSPPPQRPSPCCDTEPGFTLPIPACKAAVPPESSVGCCPWGGGRWNPGVPDFGTWGP